MRTGRLGGEETRLLATRVDREADDAVYPARREAEGCCRG
jgi:hypothetical protein